MRSHSSPRRARLASTFGLLSLVALAVLAGCTGPVAPTFHGPSAATLSATPGGHVASTSASAAEVGVPPADDACPVPHAPEREVGSGRIIERVWGCVRAAVHEDNALMDVHRESGKPVVAFDVPLGTSALDAVFHVHGGVGITAELLRGGLAIGLVSDEGGAARDSVVRFAVPSPEEGPWQIVASLHETRVLQGWSAAVELTTSPQV